MTRSNISIISIFVISLLCMASMSTAFAPSSQKHSKVRPAAAGGGGAASAAAVSSFSLQQQRHYHRPVRKSLTTTTRGTATALRYKEDGFTTGPFGQPASSSEEDIELTRQVILDHIAREMTLTPQEQSSSSSSSSAPRPIAARPTAAAAASSSTASKFASSSYAIRHPPRRKRPSERDVELTRQVILNHIAKEMSGGYQDPSVPPQPPLPPVAQPVAPMASSSPTPAKSPSTTTPKSASASSTESSQKSTEIPEKKKQQQQQQHTTTSSPSVRRANILGVSVSPLGFLVLLSTSHQLQSQPPLQSQPQPQPRPSTKDRKAVASTSSQSAPSYHRSTSSSSSSPPPAKVVVPLRLTSPPHDTTITNTTEALTIIQLLWGIDMAGVVLGPAAFQTLVGLFCSNDDDDDDEDAEDDDDYEDDGAPTFMVDECDPTKEDGCIISIEDELGLASYFADSTTSSSSSSPSSSSKLMSDQVGNLRLVNDEGGSSSSIDTRTMVNNYLAKSLPEGKMFDETSDYERVRVDFPPMSLDQVRIEAVEGCVTAAADSTGEPQDDGSTKEEQVEEQVSSAMVRPMPLKFILEITVSGSHRLEIPLYSEMTPLQRQRRDLPPTVRGEMEASSDILREMATSYDPDGSAPFVALALALRYRAPITFASSVLDALATQASEEGGSSSSSSSPTSSSSSAIVTSQKDYNAAIAQVLPQWKSLADLQSQSQRVSQNIEQSFEIHKLQGALRIATEKGDAVAANKIRAALDEMDGFDDLPTAEKKEDDISREDIGEDDEDFGDEEVSL